MDAADYATELEEADRQRALIAVRALTEDAHYNPHEQRTCLECHEVIPALRVKLLNAKRCVECQTVLEQWGERYGR